MFVDCSTIAVEESVDIRKKLKERGADFICAPVSGNAKVIKAGKLSSVCSGPEASFRKVEEMIKVLRAEAASPTWATASSRASARSRTTSCSAW